MPVSSAGGSSIGDSGAARLAEALKEGATLGELDLNGALDVT